MSFMEIQCLFQFILSERPFPIAPLHPPLRIPYIGRNGRPLTQQVHIAHHPVAAAAHMGIWAYGHRDVRLCDEVARHVGEEHRKNPSWPRMGSPETRWRPRDQRAQFPGTESDAFFAPIFPMRLQQPASFFGWEVVFFNCSWRWCSQRGERPSVLVIGSW